MAFVAIRRTGGIGKPTTYTCRTTFSKFPVKRVTVHLKVPYYVKENFHNEYQGSLRRLEMSVEEDYINNLKHACMKEKKNKENLLNKARNFGDSRSFTQAQNQPMPSCIALAQLQAL